MVFCNTSLTTIGDELVKHETPLFASMTFHHLGLTITAVFSLLATVIALTLMFLHATHYSVPYQQKHIIRILFMIPVYAVISFVSYVKYKHALYWEVLRDCYEAFAIASFFTLMCHYLEPDLHNQKQRFRELSAPNGEIKNWVWPIPWVQKCSGGKEHGPFRIPRSGLTWFNIIYVGVYQYCLIRVVFTFVAMFTQFAKRYCESSLHPAFAHVWVMAFEAASVTVAMYCLIQFYIQLKNDLAEHRPFLKILCIKLVIFFSFWQSILISFLSSSATPGGALLKPSDKIAYPDIKVGIPSMLLGIEMAIFAVIHIFAFPWKPYDTRKNSDPAAHYQGGFLGWKAFWDAFNLWDIVKAAARGLRWLFHGARHRHLDSSYEGSRKGSTRRSTIGEGEMSGFEVPRTVPPKYTPGAYNAGAYNNGMEEQELGMMASSHPDARGRPAPPTRSMSDEGNDHQGLLSHSQGIPQVPLQVPSGAESANRFDGRGVSPYGAELSREQTREGPFSDPRNPFDDRIGRAR